MNDGKYLIDSMTNVLVFPVHGIDLSDDREIHKIDKKIEVLVKNIVTKLKASHSKFEDSDFGPNENDEYGAKSFYGDSSSLPDPAGSKYPPPQALRWERPIYANDKFDSNGGSDEKKNDEGEGDNDDNDDDDEFGIHSNAENEIDIWCQNGHLFVDESSSGDVVQGQLGDCWFLSAISVLGAHKKLLKACFWKQEDFKELGFYVLRFFKDCNVIFIIVDDRIPVKAKDGRIIFAGCKDANELWVPIIEKAYAKLHGSYKALIGGYTHYGLADLTGYCPHQIVLREGYVGFAEKYEGNELWNTLVRYKSYGCLMGCSIKPNPKEKKQVEAEAGNGLYYSHAYSLLDIGEIDLPDPNSKVKIRLLKLRNPWGKGEWEGPYSDKSKERDGQTEYSKTVNQKIKEKFETEGSRETSEVDFNDGTFFISFEDWLRFFTSVFIAMKPPEPTEDIPQSWISRRYEGQWSAECGGNRDMGTWLTNPKIKFEFTMKDKNPNMHRLVFIGLYLKDGRLSMGADFYKDPLYATPLTFDIVTEEELNEFRGSLKKGDRFISNGYKGVYCKDHSFVPFDETGSKTAVKQPPYNFGSSAVEVFLDVNKTYYLIPSLYKRNQAGPFYFHVLADGNFDLGTSEHVRITEQPMVVGKAEEVGQGKKSLELNMTVAQFYSKKEDLRERIIAEAKRLKLSLTQMCGIFGDVKGLKEKGVSLPLAAFKNRMMDIGFSLSDYPDIDLKVLDLDNDGTISSTEFIEFVKDGLKHEETSLNVPSEIKPVDDLLYKRVNLDGIVTVKVSSARFLRDINTWFCRAVDDTGNNVQSTTPQPLRRSCINYDPTLTRTITPILANQIFTSSDEKEITRLERTQAMSPYSPRAQTTANMANIFGDNLESVFSENNRRVGNEAALKLHADALLRKAEETRTRHLSNFRKAFHKQKKENTLPLASQSSTIESLDDGVLRKRPFAKKIKRRDISHDKETMDFLSYKADGLKDGGIALRKAIDYDSSRASNSAPLGAPLASNIKNVDTEITAVVASNKYADEEPNIWDLLVDSVFMISTSRQKSTNVWEMLKDVTNGGKIHVDTLKMLDGTKTPLPLPSAGSVSKLVKVSGTTATPKTRRLFSGTASVVHQTVAPEQVRKNVTAAKARLQEEHDSNYFEVYRRLISISVTTQSESEGNRHVDLKGSNTSLQENCDEYLKSLFKKFDKNMNGLISMDEFRLALHELNMDMTVTDIHILFSRFSSKIPGNIDWVEFSTFLKRFISIESKNGHKFQKENPFLGILIQLKNTLHPVVTQMEAEQLTSLEAFFAKMKNSKPVAPSSMEKVTGKVFVLPESAIFQGLKQKYAKTHIERIRRLGLKITEDFHARMCRIFHNDLRAFMSFISANKSGIDLTAVLTAADDVLKDCLFKRAGSQSSSGTDWVMKLWSSFAPTAAKIVSFDNITNYFVRIFRETVENSRKEGSPDNEKSNKEEGSILFMGFDVDVLCRIIIDSLVYSKWNGATEVDNDTMVRLQLSFSGFEAYVKYNQVLATERKLRSFLRLNINNTSPTLSLLVHVFFKGSYDEVVILANDTFSGHVYKLVLKENIKQFPVDKELDKRFETHRDLAKTLLTAFNYSEKVILPALKDKASSGGSAELLEKAKKELSVFDDRHDHIRNTLTNMDDEGFKLYNPWDTPAEDAAISDLLSRLRLVRDTVKKAELVLAEDAKFLQQFKTLLDGAALPFFSILDETTLRFEVDGSLVKPTSFLRSVVFGALRSNKAVFAFITNVISSLHISISTYNDGIKESYTWTEFLFHLTNSRNPFFTAQLLPKYIKPEHYYFDASVDDKSAFKGDEDEDGSLAIHKGPVDFDGAPCPTWNKSFDFNFKLPLITSCKVISTEIAKIKVNGKPTYMVVMIRETKLKSRGNIGFFFLTLYDPKSATEYQCGLRIINTDSIDPNYTTLYNHFHNPGIITDKKRFSDCTAFVAENDLLVLGPAITPRIEFNVYNSNGNIEELLGSCQVSVSSILSGIGHADARWVTLSQNAGEIQVELSYRKETHDKLLPSQSKAISNGEEIQVSELSPHSLRGDQSGSPRRGRVKENRPEMDVLKSELRELEDQKAKLEQEVQILKSSTFNTPNTSASNNEISNSSTKGNSEVESKEGKVFVQDPKILEDIARLKTENDLLRKKLEEVEKKREEITIKSRNNSPAEETKASAPSQSQTQTPTIGIPNSIEHEDSMLIAEESADAVLRKILSILYSRHEKRINPSLGPLDGLQRMLNSFAKSDGLLSTKDFVAALSEIMIDITLQQAVRVITEIVGRSPNNSAPVASILDYFRQQSAYLLDADKDKDKAKMKTKTVTTPLLVSKTKTVANPAATASASLESADDSKVIRSSIEKLPTLPKNETAKMNESESKKVVLVAAETPSNPLQSPPSPPAVKSRPKSAAPARPSGNLNVTAPAALNNAKSSRLTLTMTGTPLNKSADFSAVGSNPLKPTVPSQESSYLEETLVEKGEEEVDWSTVPLPPGWTKKLHDISGKIFYINHSAKKTQWQHPSDHSRPSKRKKDASKMGSNYESHLG